MQAAFGCCILLLFTCFRGGLDTVQLALVMFSFHQLAQILHLHSWWSSPIAANSLIKWPFGNYVAAVHYRIYINEDCEPLKNLFADSAVALFLVEVVMSGSGH